MDHRKPKIAVIGCGNVGMRYAYALVISGLAREIVLVDRDQKRVAGEVFDLSHGAPFVSPVDISAGDLRDIAGADLVVITAGRKQQPGQKRTDLAKNNVELYRQLIPEIVKHAPAAILLVVTNPVDVLSYAAFRFSGKPAKEIIGSGTVLDSARLRFQLAKNCAIDPRNVHAYILGEHGDSEFPVWSKVMMGGVLLENYCLLCTKGKTCDQAGTLDRIFQDVRDSAYRIIDCKGETSYGVGLSLVRISEAILHDENAVLPVSTLINDYLGSRDVYLSMPAVVNRRGVREILRIGLNAKEERAFKHSFTEIQTIIHAAGL